MKPEQIGQAYDQITHLWESAAFNRENGVALHRRAITFSRSRGRALDVGCGSTGRFIDLLLSDRMGQHLAYSTGPAESGTR